MQQEGDRRAVEPVAQQLRQTWAIIFVHVQPSGTHDIRRLIAYHKRLRLRGCRLTHTALRDKRREWQIGCQERFLAGRVDEGIEVYRLAPDDHSRAMLPLHDLIVLAKL